MCEELEAARIDFVELSGGTYEDMRFRHDGISSQGRGTRREAFFAKVSSSKNSPNVKVNPISSIQFAEKIVPSLKKTTPYITGGFCSAVGMADAVRSRACAGIGIARPAASDPYLPAEIIVGKVGGATENKLPDENFGIQILAAGVQMEAIAQGNPPFDWSDPEELARFEKAAQIYSERINEAKEKGIILAGYFVLDPLRANIDHPGRLHCHVL